MIFILKKLLFWVYSNKSIPLATVTKIIKAQEFF